MLSELTGKHLPILTDLLIAYHVLGIVLGIADTVVKIKSILLCSLHSKGEIKYVGIANFMKVGQESPF